MTNKDIEAKRIKIGELKEEAYRLDRILYTSNISQFDRKEFEKKITSINLQIGRLRGEIWEIWQTTKTKNIK